MPDNISDNVSTSTSGTTSTRPAQGVSKLALLASFVAGAFAAWIFIEANEPEPEDVGPTTSMQR